MGDPTDTGYRPCPAPTMTTPPRKPRQASSWGVRKPRVKGRNNLVLAASLRQVWGKRVALPLNNAEIQRQAFPSFSRKVSRADNGLTLAWKQCGLNEPAGNAEGATTAGRYYGAPFL